MAGAAWKSQEHEATVAIAVQAGRALQHAIDAGVTTPDTASPATTNAAHPLQKPRHSTLQARCHAAGHPARGIRMRRPTAANLRRWAAHFPALADRKGAEWPGHRMAGKPALEPRSVNGLKRRTSSCER